MLEIKTQWDSWHQCYTCTAKWGDGPESCVLQASLAKFDGNDEGPRWQLVGFLERLIEAIKLSPALRELQEKNKELIANLQEAQHKLNSVKHIVD
jgi:hypothetical protein